MSLAFFLAFGLARIIYIEGEEVCIYGGERERERVRQPARDSTIFVVDSLVSYYFLDLRSPPRALSFLTFRSAVMIFLSVAKRYMGYGVVRKANRYWKRGFSRLIEC